jgi:hypothetical protein
MTGPYHYVAILAQQKLFPPEPGKRNSCESKPKEKLEKSELE